MKHLKTFRRGLIGALLLLGSAAPFTFTSCEAEHAQVNVTLNSDYSALVAAMNDGNKTLLEKLGMIEQAIKNGNVNNKDAQDLLLEAINALNGTLSDKLAAIEQAIKSQTTTFETKLNLIEAAINGGFANDKAVLDLIKEALNSLNLTVDQKLAAIEEALKNQTTSLETKLNLIEAAIKTGLADNKTALGELKTAIESLKGSVEGIDASVDDVVTALNGIKGTLGTDIADLLTGIKESIAGIQDYSEILTAIKTAIENIEINPGTPADEDAYNAGEPAEAVDLGLPSGLKWASYNIGASKPEEYGDYFAWGETKPYYTPGHAYDNPCTNWREGKEVGYYWPSYFDSTDGGSTTFDIYATDKETTLLPEHDAATANWGGSWRMPTWDEERELVTECDWEWTEVNGVNGYKVSSKSNSSKYIFLPAAGYRGFSTFYDAGLKGFYALSTLYTYASVGSFYFHFDKDVVKGDYDSRIIGESIRAVCP